MNDPVLQHAINTVTGAVLALVALIMELIGMAEATLATFMSRAGLPANMQVALLIVFALLLVIFALRAFGGVIAVLLLVLLTLFVAQRLGAGIHPLHPSFAPQPARPNIVRIEIG